MKQTVFFENTLKHEIALSGKALFSGEDVEVRLLPAAVGGGIVFKKILSSGDFIEIPISADSMHSTLNRNTMISDGSDAGVIHCVEHLMSAIFGCGLTNVVVEVSGSEIPIFDGSAKVIVDAILDVGIENQNVNIDPLVIDKPYYWSKGNVHIIALPSDELRYSYTLSYEGHPLLNSQFFTLPYTEQFRENYSQEIAPARTFCLYEEAKVMLDSGMVKGGSLDCSVVIKGEEILNPEGLRFNDEMVRHKVLDMIGDLALLGRPMLGHFIGIRSGHEANGELIKKIASGKEAEKEVEVQGAYV